MSVRRSNSRLLNEAQISAASRMFSAGVLKDLLNRGMSRSLARLAYDSSLISEIDGSETVGSLFDYSFSLLKNKQHRNEYIYKTALAQKVLLGRHSLNSAAMINEFRAGCSKADTVIFNGTSTVYEIKSERDSLTRLREQIASYSKVFARVNVIAGENHIESILNIVPEEVGILVLNNRYQISELRESTDNVNTKVESLAIFDSIRMSEAKRILRNYDIDIPKVPNTQIGKLLRCLFSELPPFEAHSGMVDVLRKTRSSAHLADFLSKIPQSLITLVLAASIKKQDQSRLLVALDTRVSDLNKWM